MRQMRTNHEIYSIAEISRRYQVSVSRQEFLVEPKLGCKSISNVFHQCTFHPIFCPQSQLPTPSHPAALQEHWQVTRGRGICGCDFCGSED